MANSLRTAFVFLLFHQWSAEAIEIVRVSDPVPSNERRVAKNVRVSGDGQSFFYESESDYESTGLAGFSDSQYHIWKTSNAWSGMGPSGDVNELVSDVDKPSDKDTKNVAVDYSGNRVVYQSDMPGDDSIVLTDFSDGTKTIKYITSLPDGPKRESLYPDISADGSTIVFESDADLIPGLNLTYRKDQIYMTKDDGASFTLVTPVESLTESVSRGAVVSGDGSYVAFRSTLQSNITATPTSKKDEAWLYRSSDGALTRVTNFQEQECNTTLIYEKMIERWGQENLTVAGATSATTASCPYAAAQGWIPSSGTIGVGAVNQPKISDDGRFMTYTASFDARTMSGTYELSHIIGGINLFLYDTVLGFTWLITQEGESGEEFNAAVEEFCCPTASSSKKRGSCSLKDEMRGYCCWQKPCAIPALNSYISGDGHSIAFVSDIDHLKMNGTEQVKSDLEIAHYHIPTSTFTHVTDTDDRNYDDFAPAISYSGDIVAFTSDFDYVTGTSITSANQIFAAKIDMGCSRNTLASNYHATPDVEVCCEFENITPDTSSGASYNLEFNGDLAEALTHVAFSSQDADAENKFCSQYVEDVKNDVACSLAIPHAMVKIVSPSPLNPCGDWMSTGIKIELELLSFGSKTAVSLKEELKQQHNEHGSFLWRGYLTKTLQDPSIAPSMVPSVSPSKSPTKSPTKAPSKSPTKSPTKAPTKSPTKAPIKPPTKAPTKSPVKSPTTTETSPTTIEKSDDDKSDDDKSSTDGSVSSTEKATMDDDDSSGMSSGAIAGTVVGVVGGIGVIGLVVYVFTKRGNDQDTKVDTFQDNVA